MHPMIWELKRLSDPITGDRGVLSVLRRGLTVPPGEYFPMFPYVRAWLTDEECDRHFATYCLVASLYAYHPVSTPDGNLGTHMRKTMDQAAEINRDRKPPKVLAHATERRFLALLRAHPDDMPQYLYRSIAFLQSKDQGVNWDQLLKDLLHWEYNPDGVRKEWALEFWRSASSAPNDEEMSEEDTIQVNSETED